MIMIRTALVVGALLLSFSVAQAQTPLSSNVHDVPVQRWLQDYLSYCESHNLEPEVTFRSPSIWLFSPDGTMTDLITIGDDPELAKLKADFPPTRARKPLEGKLSLAQTREVLSTTFGGDFTPKPTAGQWYAVLFLSTAASCEHCAIFDRGLADLESKAPQLLKVVRVRATF